MYQMTAQNGYEVQCIGRGNGLTRIADSDNCIVYEGSYNDCVRWLKDRGLVQSDGKPFPRA